MPVCLLATPDSGLADAARRRAADAGWSLCVATSAEEAVNAARHTAVDVAVLDDRLEVIGSRTVGAWLARVPVAAPAKLLKLGGPDDRTADVHRPVTAAQLADWLLQTARPLTCASTWGFSLDREALVVRSSDGEQRLTPREYRLLGVLMATGAGGASTRELAAAIGGASSVRVHMTNLRRKLRLATHGVMQVVAEEGCYRLQRSSAA